MNRYLYPVVAVHPTHAVVVAEHVTLEAAIRDAAVRDVDAEPGIWRTSLAAPTTTAEPTDQQGEEAAVRA